MNDYDNLARIYDEFTNGFDYSDYIDTIFSKISKMPNGTLALDCGCGTGTLICELIRRGYSCTGVDISPDMLSEARKKIESAGAEPHLICQPLEKLDLYGAYDFCFSSLDTINHLTSKTALKNFFRKIYNFTEPCGLLVFDVKTKSFFQSSAETKVYDSENRTLIIEGVFYRNLFNNYITVFEKNGSNYSRLQNTVTERFYPRDELKEYIKSAGFYTEKIFKYHGREIFICKKSGGRR